MRGTAGFMLLWWCTCVARWFSADAGVRWSEKFFLVYSAVWISWFGAIVVTGVYAVRCAAPLEGSVLL